MTTVAEPTTTTDPPCLCGDARFDHRSGKGGCKLPGCGCDRYEPDPDGAPVELVLSVPPRTGPLCGSCDAGLAMSCVCPPAPAAEVPGELVDGPAVPGPLEQVGEPEPAQPGDVELPDDHPTLAEVEAEPERVDEPEPDPAPVVADPAAQAEAQDLVAIIDRELGPVTEAIEADAQKLVDGPAVTRLSEQLASRLRDLDAAQAEVAQLRRDAQNLARERNEARAEVDGLRGSLVEAGRAAARDRKAHEAERAGLAAKLADANATNVRLRGELKRAVHAGLAASLRVLWRYDAEQCLTDGCGFRTTVPGLQHQHPLKPVSVLVVERDTTGATASVDEHTKEQ